MPSAEAAAKLTPEVKAVVKATAPVLAAAGTEITQAFYPLLFRTYPQVRSWGCMACGARVVGVWGGRGGMALSCVCGRAAGARVRGGAAGSSSPAPNPTHSPTHTLHPTHQPRHGPTTKQVRELFNKRNQTPAGPRGEDDEGYSAAGATPPRPAVGAQPRCVCVCSGWCGGLVGGLTPLDRTALPSTCVSPSIDPSTGTHAHTHSLPPTTHRPMEPTPHIGRWPTRCMRTRPTSRTWAR